MGAVSAFTDRNLSLPTSEQLLVVRMVLEPFLLALMESEPLILARMESEQLFLAWMVIRAVVSCLDGVRSSFFLLGWWASVLALVSSVGAMVVSFDVKY